AATLSAVDAQSFGSPSVTSTIATVSSAAAVALTLWAYAIAPRIAGSVGVPPFGTTPPSALENGVASGSVRIATAGVVYAPSVHSSSCAKNASDARTWLDVASP